MPAPTAAPMQVSTGRGHGHVASLARDRMVRAMRNRFGRAQRHVFPVHVRGGRLSGLDTFREPRKQAGVVGTLLQGRGRALARRAR